MKKLVRNHVASNALSDNSKKANLTQSLKQGAAHRMPSLLASGPTRSTPAASLLFDKSSNNFVKFAEMCKKMEERELEKAIKADYDSGDALKESKEKWKAIRLAKRAQIEDP